MEWYGNFLSTYHCVVVRRFRRRCLEDQRAAMTKTLAGFFLGPVSYMQLNVQTQLQGFIRVINNNKGGEREMNRSEFYRDLDRHYEYNGDSTGLPKATVIKAVEVVCGVLSLKEVDEPVKDVVLGILCEFPQFSRVSPHLFKTKVSKPSRKEVKYTVRKGTGSTGQYSRDHCFCFANPICFTILKDFDGRCRCVLEANPDTLIRNALGRGGDVEESWAYLPDPVLKILNSLPEERQNRGVTFSSSYYGAAYLIPLPCYCFSESVEAQRVETIIPEVTVLVPILPGIEMCPRWLEKLISFNLLPEVQARAEDLLLPGRANVTGDVSNLGTPPTLGQKVAEVAAKEAARQGVVQVFNML